jgi:hypothetical protein
MRSLHYLNGRARSSFPVEPEQRLIFDPVQKLVARFIEFVLDSERLHRLVIHQQSPFAHPTDSRQFTEREFDISVSFQLHAHRFEHEIENTNRLATGQAPLPQLATRYARPRFLGLLSIDFSPFLVFNYFWGTLIQAVPRLTSPTRLPTGY